MKERGVAARSTERALLPWSAIRRGEIAPLLLDPFSHQTPGIVPHGLRSAPAIIGRVCRATASRLCAPPAFFRPRALNAPASDPGTSSAGSLHEKDRLRLPAFGGCFAGLDPVEPACRSPGAFDGNATTETVMTYAKLTPSDLASIEDDHRRELAYLDLVEMLIDPDDCDFFQVDTPRLAQPGRRPRKPEIVW